MYHNRGDSTFAGENSRVRRLLRPRRPVDRASRGGRGHDEIYSDWITELASTASGSTPSSTSTRSSGRSSRRRSRSTPPSTATRTSSCSARSSTPTRRSRRATRTDRSCPATLDFPFQDAAAAYAGGGPATGLRDLFAAGRPVHRHGTPTPTRCPPSSATTTWAGSAGSSATVRPTCLAPRPAGARADVPHPRPPGRLLRRRAGLHRRRRGQGRPAGHVRPRRSPPTSTTTCSAPTRPTPTTTSTPTHPLYRHIGALADAAPRRTRRCATGLQQHRLADADPASSPSPGSTGPSGVEYVVALNNTTSAKAASIPTYSADMGFTGLWPSGTPAVTSEADRTLQVTVPPLSAVVFQADSAVADGPAARRHGDQARGRHRGDRRDHRRGRASSAAPAQVTFAVRAGRRRVDAARHRRQRARTPCTRTSPGWRRTPRSSYKAVARTRSGELSASSAVVTVGEVVEPPPVTGSGADYLVVHYNRPDGDYDDWGLYTWGDIDQTRRVDRPGQPFTGEDAYGRFAWVKLNPGAQQRRASSCTTATPRTSRTVRPVRRPAGDRRDLARAGRARPSTRHWRPPAGSPRIHYNRPAGDYDGWGLHLWGDAIAARRSPPMGRPRSCPTAPTPSARTGTCRWPTRPAGELHRPQRRRQGPRS